MIVRNDESNSRRTVRLRLMISEAWLPLCFEMVMTRLITMTKIVKMVMIVKNDESNLRRTVRLMVAEACLPTPLSATHRYLPVSSRPT